MKHIFELNNDLNNEVMQKMFALEQVTDGQCIYVAPNHELGFNFGYVLYLPNEFKYNMLVMAGNNNGQDENEQRNIDFKQGISNEAGSVYVDSAACQVIYANNIFNGDLPVMTPCIPNYRPYVAAEFFPRQYGLNSLMVDDQEDPFYQFDQQILAMISSAQLKVQKVTGVAMDPQIGLYGFSSAAKFANRFTALHPQLVKIVATGGTGAINIVPLSTLEGIDLNYPLGVNNIQQITGEPFNEEAFKAVKQFYFDGDQDSNELVFNDHYRHVFFSNEVREKYQLLFGDSKLPNFGPDSRYAKIKAIYQTICGENVEFKLYAEIAHNPVPAYDDVRDFFARNLANNLIKKTR